MSPAAIVFRASATDEWATPQPLFDQLDREFDFELDVAATDENAKCDRYFTKVDNGLWQPWAPARCWMNPPYGRETGAWMEKASREVQRGALVVALIPARIDTDWFHRYVIGVASEVRFVRGRVSFEGPLVSGHNASFPSLIVVYRPDPFPETVLSITTRLGPTVDL